MAKKKVKKTVKKTTDTKSTAKKKKSAKTSPRKTARKTAVKKTAGTVKKKTMKKAVRKSVPKKTAQKTASQPAAPAQQKPKRRRRRKTTLTKAELQHFRELLIVKLKEIIGDVDHIESEALKRSRLDASGDLSSMPIHMADIGSDNYEQEFALGLMHSERKLVHEIYAALKRIDEGTYGVCEGTGEPIPKPRLEGIPWARYCVEYAEKLEKGLVSEEERWFDYDNFEEDEDDEFEEEMDLDEDDDVEDDKEEKDLFFYGFDDEDEDEEDLV